MAHEGDPNHQDPHRRDFIHIAAGAAALVLAGWWLHIVIDVFTHSAEFYPAPVLYPITREGFDVIQVPWSPSVHG